MFKTVEEGALDNLPHRDKATLYNYIEHCANYFKHYSGRTSYSIKHDLQKEEYNNLYVTNDQFKAAMLHMNVKVLEKKNFEQSVPGRAPILVYLIGSLLVVLMTKLFQMNKVITKKLYL
jgi:hypothetical protein